MMKNNRIGEYLSDFTASPIFLTGEMIQQREEELIFVRKTSFFSVLSFLSMLGIIVFSLLGKPYITQKLNDIFNFPANYNQLAKIMLIGLVVLFFFGIALLTYGLLNIYIKKRN